MAKSAALVETQPAGIADSIFPADSGAKPLCRVFGVRHLSPAAAHHLHAVLAKADQRDLNVWVEYLENVMKKRGAEWRDLYDACKELV